MRIKTTNKLSIEDIPPEQRTWVNKIITPINDFLSQSIKLLNDGLSFPDNFIGQEHLFDFVYQSNALTFPIGFLWTKGAPPKALEVCSATEDQAAIAVAASWQYTQDRQVQLTHVVKFTTAPAVSLLSVGERYKIRVRVTP
jgi:hypothetical protein